MAFRNIMVESPARIAVRNDQLLVCTDTEHSVAIEDISALLLENRQITITTAALSRLGQCGCAVFTCDERHMPCAVLTPYMQHSRQLSVIRSQLAMSEPQKKRLWQAIVKAKIQNQARCLQMAGQEDSAETNTERGPPEGKKNTAKTGGVKASINLNFKKDIDEWDGKSAKTFTIGNTSKPLKSIGVKDRTIKWAGDSILHSLKHDGMSLEVVKRVPELLENPVIVMQSRTVPDRITVMGELKDDNSVPVVAIVEVNPKNDAGKLLDMNLLNNAYGKNHVIQNFLKNSKYLYLDPQKNRTDMWLHSLGLQLPSGTTTYGSIGIISYADGEVNIQGVPWDDLSAGGEEKSNRKIKASAVGSKKIAAGMTDSERANILRGKEIYAAVYNGQADGQVAGNKENFESRKKSLIAKTLEALQGEFNIPSEIANGDFDIVITTTSGLFHESGSKEITDAKQLAKLMPVLEDAVKGAVAIESHANRYYFDHDTVYFHSLIGGYIDGEKFVPIRFGVKQSMTGKNYLYVVIDSEAIKKAEVNAGPHLISQSMTPTDSAIINIAGVLEKVNSKDILKYIPDEFLDNERRELKYSAIADTIKRTNDKNDRKYAKFIRNDYTLPRTTREAQSQILCKHQNRCKIEQNYMQAEAAESCFCLVYKITAVRGHVKGGGVSLRSFQPLTCLHAAG